MNQFNSSSSNKAVVGFFLAGLVTCLCSPMVLPASAQETKAQNTTLSANAVPATGAVVQQSKRKQKQKPKKATVTKSESAGKKHSPAWLNAEAEAKIFAFVEKNHRELKSVLEHLKTNRHADYIRAMAQVKRSAERIENFRNRDPKRFRIELESWKAQSRIRLLAAKLALNENDKLRKQMKVAVKQQLQWRQRRLELEQGRLSERMDRIEKQLKQIDAVNDKRIDKLVQAEINRVKPKPKKNKVKKNK